MASPLTLQFLSILHAIWSNHRLGNISLNSTDLRKNIAAGSICIFPWKLIIWERPRGASHDYFSSLPLDYKLSSIHFIPVADGETMIDVDGRPENFLDKMSKYFDNDIRYVVDKFYERTLEMIEAGGFDIIGHFDKIGFNASHFKPGIELERWYQKHLDNVIDAIAAKGIIAEVNTKAWEAPVGAAPSQIATYAPRLFPSPDTIRKLVSARIPVAINSDAHYPERISAGREAAFQIIDS